MIWHYGSKKTCLTTTEIAEWNAVRALSFTHCKMLSKRFSYNGWIFFCNRQLGLTTYLRSDHCSILLYLRWACRLVISTQPTLGVLIAPSSCPSQHFCSEHPRWLGGCTTRLNLGCCRWTIDVGLCCMQWWPMHTGGIAQCRFVVVKRRHQSRYRVCWKVIRRSREIKRDVYFMKKVQGAQF